MQSQAVEEHPAGNWPTDWQLRVRMWVERDGRAVLGKGRADLLEAIDRSHSISAAARALGMSYRHAWKLVQAANVAAGAPLVTSAVGGRRGGGATLTEHGRRAVDLFRRLERDLRSHAADHLRRGGAARHGGVMTVHVAAAISLQEALGQVVTEYALERPATRIQTVFGASNELVEQAAAGAAFDVVITAGSDALARLREAGLVARDDAVAFAANRLAIIGPRRQAAAGSIKTIIVEGTAPIAIAAADVPVGGAWKQYLEARKWYERVRSRLVTVGSSRGVLAALAAGHAMYGLGFASDGTQAHGFGVAGIVRRRDFRVDYRACPMNSSPAAEEARSFIVFLGSDKARAAFRRGGFDRCDAR